MVIFILFTLALPAYVTYVTVFMPVKVASHLVHLPDGAADTLSGTRQVGGETLAMLREISELEMERAYLKNRLDISKKSDSVYMAVNLDDSLLTLEIKGVVVRSCRITGFEASRRLGKVDHDQLLQWSSTPFELEHDLSTIPKIPYVIKAAPKDTLEAQALSAKPMPPDTTSVYFTLFFNKDLVLEIEQSEPADDVDKDLIIDYFRAKKKILRKEALHAVLHGNAPDHDIYIRLQVSPADARAIYRGIPYNASLALKL